MNVVCLVIDRLHAGYLGAYGNTWISTPNLDRLAADSVVFDRMVIDSPRVELTYRSAWQGIHAMCPAVRATDRQPLPAIFSAAGWHAVLLADEQPIAEHPLAEGFSERIFAGDPGNLNLGARRSVVSSLDETDMAAFFAAAGDQLELAKPPFFLWLHTGTLGRVWDAPLEFREQYTDELDPSPGDWANVPDRFLPKQFNPDERVAIAHAYAGQVSAIDQLLGVFMDTIEAKGLLESTLIALYSPSGFPLGEHRRIGKCDEALYCELTHVPCMLHVPGAEFGGQRFQELVQPCDLPATILDFAGPEGCHTGENSEAGMGRSLVPLIRGVPKTRFDRACTIGLSNERRIITPAWSLRVMEVKDEQSLRTDSELFVQPDDWYEINEIADRCPEIVEKLQLALGAFENACQGGRPMPADLPEELVQSVD